MKKKELEKIFKTHPEIKAVYIDANGKAWVNEETAKNQSKSGEVKTVKRSEVFTNTKKS